MARAIMDDGRKMMLLSRLLFFVLVSLSMNVATQSATSPRRVFTGEPTLLVVSGYSTSSLWPHILQKKIDRYYGGKRIIEVRSAVIPSTPIARLMDVRTGKPKKPWHSIDEAIAAKGNRPVVVLAQQSLQWSFGHRQATGIRGPEDEKRIGIGSLVFRRYVDLLHRTGADHVFMATHIYKKAMEPAIHNERYALEAFVRRDPPGFSAGPNLWSLTRENFPLAYEPDQVHINPFGAELVAQQWFKFLLENDGLQAPDWSRQQVSEAEREALAGKVSTSPVDTASGRPNPVRQKRIER